MLPTKLAEIASLGMKNRYGIETKRGIGNARLGCIPEFVIFTA